MTTTNREREFVKRRVIQFAVLVAGALAGIGANTVIGAINARGDFRLDGASAVSNATVFEGTKIETHQPASLDLASGPRLTLGADSISQIFGRRMILSKGSSAIENAEGFRIEARSLSIDFSGGAGRVMLARGALVDVAVENGVARVLNSRGTMVAALEPNEALEFDPQAPDELEKLTGCLHSASGHFLITDELTNVTVELTGSGLAKEADNRVEVTGAMEREGGSGSGSGASQVVRVRALKRLGKGCLAVKAAAAGSVGAPPAGGKAGGIKLTTIAIIGGVAAAAISGVAVSGAFATAATPAESR